MSTNYQIGYRFEIKCRNYWRRKGWSCDRTPASKSPYDLTGVRKVPFPEPLQGDRPFVMRIQCQTHLPFSKKKVQALIDWCENEATQPVLQWGIGGKVHTRHAADYLMEDLGKVKIEGRMPE